MILFFFGRCSFVFLPRDEGACAVVLLSFFLFGRKGGQEIPDNELCGRKNNLPSFLFVEFFLNNFLSRCQNARAIKKNASIYFFPPRTLRARLLHRIRDRMVASTALFQPTTLLRLVLLYLQRRDDGSGGGGDDDDTDEEETTVTKALVSVLSSQFSFVRFTDIFWAYLAATATVFSRSVVKSNAATSEWSLLDGVTVGLETVVGRGTVASGIGAGQIYGVGYEVTSSAAAAINQVFEQQYDFRKRTRRRKLLDVDLKAYAASVSRTINATKLASMIVNRRRSVKNTSRKLLFDDDDDDIERNMLHTLVPMFLGNVPVSVRDEFIQSLQSVIIDPSLVLSFELNIARVNVLIPRKGYSAFENAQLFRAGQRNLWSGYLQKRRSGVGASFSSAVGASFSPGDKLAYDIQDTTEKLKAATDILDQLNADRVAKAHFSNATKIDVDPFNLPDGSVVPDSEPVGLASLTYAITISINFGQRIGVLA